ncbi:MAG: uroporphyrinogen decarboxylase family protein [Clostridia bacterium]
MKKFDSSFLDFNYFQNNTRKPDFNNFLDVLYRRVPKRPTLFEFFINSSALQKKLYPFEDSPYQSMQSYLNCINAFKHAGYDYYTINSPGFSFKINKHRTSDQKSVSMNHDAPICDEETFAAYEWESPDDYDFEYLAKLEPLLPEGMKLVMRGPGGVLENVTSLLGFDQMCYLIADDEPFVQKMFDAVGSRLLRYYEICAKYDSIGALISNDDWGFNTQTMLKPSDMRKFVFPWHKRIVEAIHAQGKPAILHSCGNLKDVMDDIIFDMKYDAKHSYEDNITPVEEAYELWGDKIAILGGLDLNFICTATPEEVYNRSVKMLERTATRGGYALGSGNSIPEYVPEENFLAMLAAVNQNS